MFWQPHDGGDWGSQQLNNMGLDRQYKAAIKMLDSTTTSIVVAISSRSVFNCHKMCLMVKKKLAQY